MQLINTYDRSRGCSVVVVVWEDEGVKEAGSRAAEFVDVCTGDRGGRWRWPTEVKGSIAKTRRGRHGTAAQ